MARIKYIAGNWKMNKTTAEAVALAGEIVEKAKGLKCKIAICPPFTVLSEVNKVVRGTKCPSGSTEYVR